MGGIQSSLKTLALFCHSCIDYTDANASTHVSKECTCVPAFLGALRFSHVTSLTQIQIDGAVMSGVGEGRGEPPEASKGNRESVAVVIIQRCYVLKDPR